jgi:hypothetical protein
MLVIDCPALARWLTSNPQRYNPTRLHAGFPPIDHKDNAHTRPSTYEIPDVIGSGAEQSERFPARRPFMSYGDCSATDRDAWRGGPIFGHRNLGGRSGRTDLSGDHWRHATSPVRTPPDLAALETDFGSF